MNILNKFPVRNSSEPPILIPRKGRYPEEYFEILKEGYIATEPTGRYFGVYRGGLIMTIMEVVPGPQLYHDKQYPLAINRIEDVPIPPGTRFIQLLIQDGDLLVWTCHYLNPRDFQNQPRDGQKRVTCPEIQIQLYSVKNPDTIISTVTLKQDPGFVCFNLDVLGNALIFGSGTVSLIRIKDMTHPIVRSIGFEDHTTFAVSHVSPSKVELYKRCSSGNRQLVQVYVLGCAINQILILEDTSRLASSRLELAITRYEKDPHLLRVVAPTKIAVINSQEKRIVSALPIKPECSII